MSDTVLAVIISGFLTLAGVYYTQKQAARAAKQTSSLESKKVDAEAYERARDIDKGIVQGLREEIERLTEQVNRLRAELDAERAENSDLKEKLADVERTVDRMRRLMLAADLDVPAEFRP